MSRQVLALKWRPKTFDEVVGQQHVLRPLQHSLQTGNLHHAYLFSGTRGIGKTTLARILARCLNCEKGVSADPCGECSACTAILGGSFPSLIEVDAASRTNVSETRDLLETVAYSPMDGRYKVYLIDEVHMLSGHSFNALLKTLEEPPEHICFLFATTEPEKIPATVLSRCLHFNLQGVGEDGIAAHLQAVLEQEKIGAASDAIALLARAARGSIRDAMTLTEQAISHGAGELKAEQVAAMLGTMDRAATGRLLTAIAAADGAKLLAEMDALASLGADPARVLDELLRFLYEIALEQSVAGSIAAEEIQALAASMEREEVQLYYQIALLAHRDLHLSPDSWVGLRMSLLRMLAFAPEGSGGQRAKKPEPPAATELAATQPKPVTAAQPEPVAAAEPEPAAETTAAAEVEASSTQAEEKPAEDAAEPVAELTGDAAVLAGHPLVQTLLQQYDAEIQLETVRRPS